MTAIAENIKKVLNERASLWETEGKPLADIATERAFSAEEAERSAKVDTAFEEFNRRLTTLRQQAQVEQQVREFATVLASDPEVRSAFETELRSVLVTRSQSSAEFSFTGKELKRALSVGVGAAGGNAVPTTFLDQLIQGMRDFSSVLAAGATVIATSSGEQIKIPRVATFGSAVQVAEATAIVGTDPTFDQATLSAYKLGEIINVSRELVEDAVFDVEGFVVELISQNIGLLLGSRLAVGTGTGQTTGIITAATVGKTGAASVAGAVTFDDVIDLFYSVSAPYRAQGSFLIADGALAGLRKLKATGSGEYLWQPAVVAGQPDTILGKAVYADPNILAPAAGVRSLGFGDVSKYWVRMVNTLKVDRSDHAAFSTDQVAFRGTLRADGALVDPNAFKVFVGGAA